MSRFAAFVEATGYVTIAEQKKPDWEEIKKQLPPGTPKSQPEEYLVAASLDLSFYGQVSCHEQCSQMVGVDSGSQLAATARDRDSSIEGRKITGSSYCLG